MLTSILKMIRTDRTLGAVTDNDPATFEQLYQRWEDPWGLRTSPFTPMRYLALLQQIAEFTPCRNLLDVGCGEGLFTRYLTGVAANVVGIDVSATAIERARRTVPRAEFHCVKLQDFNPCRRFDIVVAVEMLYYAEDIERALHTLRTLGDVVFISYTRKRAAHIQAKLQHAGFPIVSTFHSFFQSDTHGFTVARFGRNG